jgi:hypothetical protein
LRWRELDPGSQVELREPVAAMLRERHKQRPCEADRIDALHRDGQARSSDEAAVTAVERRGLVTRATDNRPTAMQEEPLKVAKPFAV